MSDDGHTQRLKAAVDGRYRVERELGEGGMATVYLAEDIKHKRRVALKVLRPELAAALGADRFLREIETTAGLRHPHILPLYDSGHEDGVLYYVMPFVEGRSLRDHLDREGQLPLDDVLEIVGSVADALSYAHGRGVIHRDIKPENILLEDDHTVLADFGIAHAVSESGGDKLTHTGAVLGTPLYMSPEQANAEPVDARSDLYALGCVAYEMLVGSPPFTGPSGFVVMARHALDPVPAIRTARPGVPPVVADAVERALAKTPADRFSTVEEWRDALTAPSTSSTESRPGPEPPETEPGLTVPLPERPSIAILPFKSLGSDPGQDYIADGIRLGIQATLVQLSGLFLVNASTPNLYRGSEASATSVGEELGVRYILEGAGQQAGQRIRITVQLTDVGADRVIWAERYDHEIDDVFELQDAITREVIAALNVELLHHELGRGWFAKIDSPEAHECFYRGASYLYEGTKQDNAAARDMFMELYRLQPTSVTGPSNVAVTHWLDAFHGWSDSPEDSLAQADEWAKKAMEYEDNNGIGHAIFGHLRLLEREHEQAIEACSAGVQLRESCPLAHGLLGLVLNYLGDPQGAIREVREALKLERVYPPWLLTVLAAAYRDAGEFDTSITAARQSLRLDPGERDALLVLCSDYQLAGDQAEATRIADDVKRRDPRFRLGVYAEGHPYKDSASLDRVTGALRAAGLPD